MITGRQLKRVSPKLTDARALELANIISQKCNEYKVNKDMLEELLANATHESGDFTIKAENMNYSTARRIIDVWPSRFAELATPTRKRAFDFVRNPVGLANEVYNGRMGNRQRSNDGFNFRGGGYAQITGRDAYQQYMNFKKANMELEAFARLVQTTEEFAIDSLFWFFCEFKNLEQLSVDDKMMDIVKRWNGGFIGLEDRLRRYDLIKRVLS